MIMNENFLYYIWENRLLKADLSTVTGEPLTIVHPGFRNHDSGPDFSNAKIKIGDTLWAGSVEIHVLASDWRRHRHQNDKAYNNVVLHVVYENDAESSSVPVLRLKDSFDETLFERYQDFVRTRGWIPCGDSIARIQHFTWLSWLDRLAVERLEQKSKTIESVLRSTGNDWEETLYRIALHYFGMKVNGDGFEKLAAILPHKILLKHADNLVQVEAVLFGCAGLLEGSFADDYPKLLQREFAVLKAKFGLKTMPAESWRFMRMRPSNFPTIRLSQLAQLVYLQGNIFSKMINAKSVEELHELLSVGTSDYWTGHFMFDKPSQQRSKKLGRMTSGVIIVNAFVPIMFCYGKMHEQNELCDRAMALLESVEAENNFVSKNFASFGVAPQNAMQSQALIHLYENYCKSRRCLECRIGNVLIREG